MVNGSFVSELRAEVLPQAVYVFVHHGIGNQVRRLFHLLGKFLAHFYLAVQRVPVEQPAIAAHIAVADGIQVVDSLAMVKLVIVSALLFPGPCLILI